MKHQFTQKILTAALMCGGLVIGACASTQSMGPDEARLQVQQLMTLYDENRPKFVVQKQEIEQAKKCTRAVALREAVEKLQEEDAMSPEKNETLTLVAMELQQAEKNCQGK